MIVVGARVDDLDGELSAGRVPCQRCGCPLRPWGFARARLIRRSSGSSPLWWRPRRAWCVACRRTDVLLPSQLLPRRRDDVEVIGAALVAHAAGAGHRRVAGVVDRPPSTVRNWLRAFRTNAERLRILGAMLRARLDPDGATTEPTGSATGDAVEALAGAARSLVLRLGIDGGGPWALINVMTAGRLLASVSAS